MHQSIIESINMQGTQNTSLVFHTCVQSMIKNPITKLNVIIKMFIKSVYFVEECLLSLQSC